MPQPRRSALAAALVATIGLAGCSGDGADDAELQELRTQQTQDGAEATIDAYLDAVNEMDEEAAQAVACESLDVDLSNVEDGAQYERRITASGDTSANITAARTDVDPETLVGIVVRWEDDQWCVKG